MRHINFTCLLILITITTRAQLRIQPQIGVESSTTGITFNDMAISPSSVQFLPKLALRMEYKFKKGHGVFAGLSTNAPSVDFNFSDLQTPPTTYNYTRQNLQVRFEGGYQFNTKPIYFSNKGKAVSSAASAFRTKRGHEGYGGYVGYGTRESCIKKMSCGKQSARSNCSKSNSCSKKSERSAPQKNSYMRIIPSVGLAFIPSQPDAIETKNYGGQTNFNYKAGAWSTAVTTGAAVEFGNRRQAKYIVSVNYLKGFGNLGTKTVNSVSNGKSFSAMMSSQSTGWTVSLGVPFSLSRRKPEVKREYERPKPRGFGNNGRFQSHGKCGQYR